MVDNDDKLFKEITFDVTPDFAEEYYKETGETMMIGMPFFLEVFEFSGTAIIMQDPF